MTQDCCFVLCSCQFHPVASSCLTAMYAVANLSNPQEFGGVLTNNYSYQDCEIIKKLKSKALALSSLHSILCQIHNRNSSAKNYLTIGMETIRDQIKSLIVGHEKILHKASAADVALAKAEKQSNLYTTGVNVIPCNKISGCISQTTMAEVIVTEC